MTFRLRTILFGLACAGTVSVGCAGKSDETDTSSGSFPETCAEVQELAVDETGDRPDNGTYTLYVDGEEDQPWDAYCHDMKRAEPIEYLSVNEADNYSEIADGEEVVRTTYRRIRIDPVRLELWPLDDTFADTSDDDNDLLPIHVGDLENIPLGFASYASGVADNGGAAEAAVDLADTAFTLDESVDDDDYFNIGYFVAEQTADGSTVVGNLGDVDGTVASDEDLASFDTSSDLSSFVLVALSDEGITVAVGADTQSEAVVVAADYENMLSQQEDGTDGLGLDGLEIDSVVIPLEYTGIDE